MLLSMTPWRTRKPGTKQKRKGSPKSKGKDAFGEKGKGKESSSKRKGNGKITICLDCGKTWTQTSRVLSTCTCLCNRHRPQSRPVASHMRTLETHHILQQHLQSDHTRLTALVCSSDSDPELGAEFLVATLVRRERLVHQLSLPRTRWFNKAPASTTKQETKPASVEGASPCSASRRTDWISCALDSL